MDFGIALPTAADSWKVAQRAEELGFSHAWFYDTQMLERRLLRRHGRGGGEHEEDPPRHRRAGAVEPHRAGRGQCAGDAQPAGARPHRFRRRHRLHRAARDGLRRDEGQGHGDLHRAGLRAAARARRSTSRWKGRTRRSASSIPSCRCSTPKTRSRSISRPSDRARATLTAKLKAGWIDFVSNVAHGIKEVTDMRDAWTKAGHAVGDLQATAFALGCVLADGEPADSERAMAQAGPARGGDAASRRRRGADGLQARRDAMPAKQRPEVEGYVALARTFEPKDAPYLNNHRGHLMFVKPEEKKFVTADLIARRPSPRPRPRSSSASRRCGRRATPSSRSRSCPARRRRSRTGAASAQAFE